MSKPFCKVITAPPTCRLSKICSPESWNAQLTFDPLNLTLCQECECSDYQNKRPDI